MFLYCCSVFYQINKIKKQLSQQDEQQKKALAEAGNAITDTIRVAFDNIKKNAADRSRINSKLTEHNSRIYRLEQNNNRLSREKINSANTPKYKKENLKQDENEQ